MNTQAFRNLVEKEKVRQLELWGKQDHHLHTWTTILCEEAGEIAKASLDDKSNLLTELVHTAAVIETWAETL